MGALAYKIVQRLEYEVNFYNFVASELRARIFFSMDGQTGGWG